LQSRETFAHRHPGTRLLGGMCSSALALWSLLIYPPGCAAHGLSQERLSGYSNSALMLRAPVTIDISLQLLVAHVRKLVHAFAFNALYLEPH
jgi:hypothetical protein